MFTENPYTYKYRHHQQQQALMHAAEQFRLAQIARQGQARKSAISALLAQIGGLLVKLIPAIRVQQNSTAQPGAVSLRGRHAH